MTLREEVELLREKVELLEKLQLMTEKQQQVIYIQPPWTVPTSPPWWRYEVTCKS
jgi:hypothetical protein